MENKIIFYWNNKLDPEYHTHMWTNRICLEKITAIGVKKPIYIFFVKKPHDNDTVFEAIDSVVGKNYKLVVWFLDHSNSDEYYDIKILKTERLLDGI